MSKQFPVDDFPFLNRLLDEIKALREAKRPRRASLLKQESKPSPAKRENGGYAISLARNARQGKVLTTMANPLPRGQQ